MTAPFLNSSRRAFSTKPPPHTRSAPQWPHTFVIDQSPLSGSRLPAASTIELTVAN